MIKILHLITSLDTGGAEVMLQRLLTGMDHSVFENRVICLIPVGPIGEKIAAQGIPVASLAMRPGRPTLAGFIRLLQLLSKSKPDILQTWLYHADLMGLVAGRLVGLPVVWNIRAANMEMSQYHRLSSAVLKTCARLSAWPAAVIVNSVAGQKYHQHLGYHPRRWIHIPNGINVSQFRPDPDARLTLRAELGLGVDALLIGLVARFDPMKDHLNFLLAAGLFAGRFADVHFVLVGEGVEASNPTLKTEIERHKLTDGVHLLGRREDVSKVMAGLDIACSSSSGEGFPNVVAEAMSCGVPCVVTDAGDSAYLIRDTGIVVPPKDPQALAEGWGRMIALGAEGRKALGMAARRRIEQHFRLDTTTRQYENLYESVVSSRSERYPR